LWGGVFKEYYKLDEITKENLKKSGGVCEPVETFGAGPAYLEDHKWQDSISCTETDKIDKPEYQYKGDDFWNIPIIYPTIEQFIKNKEMLKLREECYIVEIPKRI
jgi:hypothetical protein